MGQLFVRDNDENQALHFHQESYRCFPVDLEVISYLGVFHVSRNIYERAIQFFERAAEIKPTEVKWRLMVASCYRRMNSFKKAYELYKKIHDEVRPYSPEVLRLPGPCFLRRAAVLQSLIEQLPSLQFPDNIESLRYLAMIGENLQIGDYQKYEELLEKAKREHSQQQMQQPRQQQAQQQQAQQQQQMPRQAQQQEQTHQQNDQAQGQRSATRQGQQRQEASKRSAPGAMGMSSPMARGGRSAATTDQKANDDDDLDDDDLDNLLPE